MDVLLVGDSRTSNNWGARATSIAMATLAARAGRISAAIDGAAYSHHSSRFEFVGSLLTAGASERLLDATRSRPSLDGPTVRRLLARWVGIRDFVSGNPAETARTVQQYRTRYPFLAHLYDAVAQADAVVINGEGDLVFTTPPRREALFLLGIAELGIRLGKPVIYANAMVSDCPTTGRNAETFNATRRVLSRCSAVLLRDPESIELVTRHMHDVECEMVPDAVFSWSSRAAAGRLVPPADGDLLVPFPEQDRYLGRLDFSAPYIVVSGGAAAAENTERARACYTEIVRELQTLGMPVYLAVCDGRDSFLEDVATNTGTAIVPLFSPVIGATAVLANARAFVGGRYHAAALAALGGTPGVHLASVAHKMRSLQALLGYDHPHEFPAFPTAGQTTELARGVREIIEAGDAMRACIRAAAAHCGARTERVVAVVEGRQQAATSEAGVAA